MTPAEHRENAERLMSAASYFTADPAKDKDSRSIVAEAALLTAQAQVHATLALAPTPPPQPTQPQQRIDTSRPVFITDITATQIHISKSSQGDVYIAQENEDEDCAWGVVVDDPTQLRLFAAALTAHADRLESKP